MQFWLPGLLGRILAREELYFYGKGDLYFANFAGYCLMNLFLLLCTSGRSGDFRDAFKGGVEGAGDLVSCGL